jgi:hypothetical protein
MAKDLKLFQKCLNYILQKRPEGDQKYQSGANAVNNYQMFPGAGIFKIIN